IRYLDLRSVLCAYGMGSAVGNKLDAAAGTFHSHSADGPPFQRLVAAAAGIESAGIEHMRGVKIIAACACNGDRDPGNAGFVLRQRQAAADYRRSAGVEISILRLRQDGRAARGNSNVLPELKGRAGTRKVNCDLIDGERSKPGIVQADSSGAIHRDAAHKIDLRVRAVPRRREVG